MGVLGVGCWWLPAFVDDLDDGAQRTVGDDALGTALDGRYMCGLLAVPTSEGTETEGLSHPEHIVAIAFCLLIFVGIELRLFQFQLFLELAIEVESLPFVEVDADAIELAFEVDTMVVLDIIGVGGIATSGDRLDVIVLLVLLQVLVLAVAQHHLCEDTSRVGTWLTLGEERHGVLLLLVALKIDQETELVEGLILIEVVELAGYLLAVDGDEG